MGNQPGDIEQRLARCQEIAGRILSEVSKTVVGQTQLQRRLLTALITGGHVLLEGVPGLAKTLSIKALAQAVHGEFRRIQFTPDLLPADIIGTEIYQPHKNEFVVRTGPVFANFVLADEINRAPAKVQSALLETMQEHQVTIGQQTLHVPEPFLVLATQNPIEQEGTYPLPEAQIDRFLMKVRVTYPSKDEERLMLDTVTDGGGFQSAARTPVATLDDIRALQENYAHVYVDQKIRGYIVDLVTATRKPADFKLPLESLIELGASPRATLSLFYAARAEALLSGQSFVIPQHVKNIAADVLRHRLILTYEAEAQGLTTDSIIEKVLNGVPVP